MRRAVLFAFVVGCSFSGPAVNGDGDGMALATVMATALWLMRCTFPMQATLLAWATSPSRGSIDTDTPLDVPTGVTFDIHEYEDAGHELALLHVRHLTLPDLATVTVVGSRPLVIIAETITIAGRLDASASLDTPGASGFGPGTGASPGIVGEHVGSFRDSGGGGGGNSTRGGIGGRSNTVCVSAEADDGPGGVAVNDPLVAVLIGGSGGASGSPGDCQPTAGGAGGGGVQLTAVSGIEVGATGSVLAGGGGGAGGLNCGGNDSAAGSGGGAGGAIVFQAPATVVDGIIAANGGCGGCGGSAPGGTGGAGENGQPTTIGATGGGTWGALGGVGGALNVDAAELDGADDDCDGNGGGGGGAAGQVFFSGPSTGVGEISPAVVMPLERLRASG